MTINHHLCCMTILHDKSLRNMGFLFRVRKNMCIWNIYGYIYGRSIFFLLQIQLLKCLSTEILRTLTSEDTSERWTDAMSPQKIVVLLQIHEYYHWSSKKRSLLLMVFTSRSARKEL